ncbi:MAG: hypothetical protein WC900_00900 [Oscillospiraceae bacterium]
MKKSIVTLVFIILLTNINSVSLNASTSYDYSINDDGITINGVDTDSIYLKIPNDIDGIPVTAVYIEGKYDLVTVKEIYFPENISYIEFDAPYLCNFYDFIETFIVSEDNIYYSSKDGVLYNKDMTELITYPGLKTSTYFKIPDSVECIHGYAFECSKKLDKIELPGETSGCRVLHSEDRKKIKLEIKNRITSTKLSVLKLNENSALQKENAGWD